MKNKYICTFLLHALGDTIGFKNGDWEYNYNKHYDANTVNEMIYEFIDLGGINGIEIKDWIVSDDTLFHIAVGKALLKYDNKFDEKLISIMRNIFSKTYKILLKDYENGIDRQPNYTTLNSIIYFTEDPKKKDARNLPYDNTSIGNGACMRNLCIGLAFHKKEDLNILIETSIMFSKLTHNSPIGFLAGMTSALFTSFAIRELPINKWVFELLELLESDKIKKYINIKNNDELKDYIMYINNWKHYIDTRFVNEKPIKSRSMSNMIFRIKYYFDNFIKTRFIQNNEEYLIKHKQTNYLDENGYITMIMVYNSLLDCDGKWEKVVFYSMLHPGDSDTIGAITAGLYGAMYGYGDVPIYMLEHIEKKSTLIELGEKIYEKFYSEVV